MQVLIPIRGIKEVNESQNVNKAEQKYLEIVTEDYSEFWFVGFLRYDKALKHLNKAISMANKVTQAETHTNKSRNTTHKHTHTHTDMQVLIKCAYLLSGTH